MCAMPRPKGKATAIMRKVFSHLGISPLRSSNKEELPETSTEADMKPLKKGIRTAKVDTRLSKARAPSKLKRSAK